MDNSTLDHYSFLQGKGEMKELVRSYNWSTTSIGPPEMWPESLLTTLAIVINSSFPMFIFWGDDLICFYNDAYRPSLGIEGKHPAIGKKGKDVWPEIWHFIGPIIEKVLTSGEPVWYEDLLLPIYRNGAIEDVYWTFSYSPIFTKSNEIEGVLVTCNETTEKVKAVKSLVESEKRFQNLVNDATVGIVVLTGEEMTVQIVNQAYCNLIGTTTSDLLGRKLFEVIPEAAKYFRDILLTVRKTGKPTVLNDHPYYVSVNSDEKKTGYLNLVYQPYKEADGLITGVMALCQDVTEQVLARKKLEESQAQFNILADSILQMIWVTDPNGMHEYYNQRWYDFTGATVEQTAGEGWNEVFHPDDRERAWKTWRHSLDTGEIYEIEYRLRRKDGEYVWVLGRAAPLYDSEGHIAKWFGTCTDIHEQKKLQQQKEEFISIASHELRTPLTSLKASLQFLDRQVKKEPNSNHMISKMVGSANTHVNKITALVSDLLDVTKIEQGQLVLRKSNFKISDIINSCCETAVHTGIDLHTSGDLDIEVNADYVKIEQVLTNLLNNSIKYAPKSGHVEIHSEQTDQDLKISVQDFGPGIPAEKIPHLFGIYYRADAEGNQYSGLGLGLYICYRIISNHGGQIGVESVLGEGSRFWFTLPLR